MDGVEAAAVKVPRGFGAIDKEGATLVVSALQIAGLSDEDYPTGYC